MIVTLRQKGRKDLSMAVFTKAALKHLVYTLVKWIEKEMPEWAEIIYSDTTKIY